MRGAPEVAAGYFAVWTAFGLVAIGVGLAGAGAAMRSAALARIAPITAGAIVLAAGALQFTAWKARHLALRHLGVTAVYVTHDQAEAMALGDRIVVMEKGRIAQIGTPQEIYYRPATPFVADFIGTMNRLAGEVVDGHLTLAAGRVPLGPVAASEVMFRPEDVRLVAPGEHHLQATILASFFLGDHTRLVVDVGTGAPLVVESAERRTWPRGETVHLAVAQHAILPVPPQAP